MVKFICKSILLFFFVFSSLNARGQSQNKFNKELLVHSGLTTVLIASPIVFGSTWYNSPSKFHFFNDHNLWLGMDKLGHSFSAYHLLKQSKNLYRWSGVSSNKSLAYANIFSFSYLLSFEILDGFQSTYGFSISDVAANTAGLFFYDIQDLYFGKEIIKYKFSYSQSPYAELRPEVLGNNHAESLLKDYNGQSYWLSFSPFTFKKDSKLKWLCLSFGYSVDAKLIGDQNYSSINGSTYIARNKFLLSLDIDVDQLPIKNKWLKGALSIFNTIKVPLPALSLSNRGFEFHPVYY